MDRMNELWKAVGRTDAPPTADPRAVKARVNAALNADPEERRSYMRQKLRAALAAAAIAAAITGSALAAGSNLDVLQEFFQGDTSSAQKYVDTTAYSASSEDYMLTVNSSVSDENAAYLVVTVTANSGEALLDFAEKDLYLDMEVLYEEGGAENIFAGLSMGFSSVGELKEARTENSRSFTMESTLMGTAYAVRVGLWPGMRGEGSRLELEVPLDPAPSVTVEMGVSGVGIPNYQATSAQTLTIKQCTLTPFACQITCTKTESGADSLTYPRLFFRMADGSIQTQSQMMRSANGNNINTTDSIDFTYRFLEIQDLEDIRSVIAFDMEYPLDGSDPIALEHDPLLDPVALPKMEPLGEHAGFAVPVRALTEALGGVCTWDPATGDAVCTYRGVTVAIHPGSDTAAVDGLPVSTLPPAVQDGSITADSKLFFDAWGLSGYVMWLDWEWGGDVTYGDWLIIP